MENEIQRIQISENVFLQINSVEVVGDLYDAQGNKLGTGNHIIKLNATEVQSLGMTDIQTISDKFFSTQNQ